MRQLVITSLFHPLVVGLVMFSAAVMGSTRPAGVPGAAVNLPEAPALTLTPAELHAHWIVALKGERDVRPDQA